MFHEHNDLVKTGPTNRELTEVPSFEGSTNFDAAWTQNIQTQNRSIHDTIINMVLTFVFKIFFLVKACHPTKHLTLWLFSPRSRALLAGGVLTCSALAMIAFSVFYVWDQNKSTLTILKQSGFRGRNVRARLHEEKENTHESACDCSAIQHCYMCFEPSSEHGEEGGGDYGGNFVARGRSREQVDLNQHQKLKQLWYI